MVIKFILGNIYFWVNSPLHDPRVGLLDVSMVCDLASAN